MSVPKSNPNQSNDVPELTGASDANPTDTALPLPFKLAGATTLFHLPKPESLCVGRTLTPRRGRLWFQFVLTSSLFVSCAYVELYLHPHQHPWLVLLGGAASARVLSTAMELLHLGNLRKVTTDSEGIELIHWRSSVRVPWRSIKSLELGTSWSGSSVMKIFSFDTVVVPLAGSSREEFNELFALIQNRAGLVRSKDSPSLYERPESMLTAPQQARGIKP